MTPTQVLSSIPAFAGLAPDELRALVERLDEARFEPGAVIVKEGEVESASLYIIEDGSVEITRGEGNTRVELATLGPGQYFGELALIDGAPRPATATTSSVHVLILHRQEFVDFIHRDLDAAMRIMAELAQRLRHTNELVSAATEDMQRLGGMEALDAPYSRVSIWEMIQKRAGWLAVVLALFVPLIISSGGNSGSQGTSLIIRALALRELQLRDWGWVFGREVFSGLVLGTLLGAIGFARIVLWQDIGWANYGPHYLAVALTVWASLIGVVGFGSTAGSMLPFGLRRLGFDPATSSAPFVATLVDVTGLVIYFTIASIILRGLVL
jgi:cation transporter-like permease